MHEPLTLNCDNQSTIKQAIAAVDQRNSRHIGMRHHYLRFQCHVGKLILQFVPSNQQLADLMIKCVPQPLHERLRTQLGVIRRSDFIPVVPAVGS
jgi:hypothetical protein